MYRPAAVAILTRSAVEGTPKGRRSSSSSGNCIFQGEKHRRGMSQGADHAESDASFLSAKIVRTA